MRKATHELAREMGIAAAIHSCALFALRFCGKKVDS
jgi:hypothetical protein